MKETKLEYKEINKGKSYLDEDESKLVSKYHLMNSIKRLFLFKRTRDLFRSKFNLIVGIITFEGDIRFYLTKPRKGKIVIKKGLYIVNDKHMIKSNLKYHIIFFNENNPLSRNFSHIRDKLTTSDQLKKFLDSELLGMVLRSKKDKKLSVIAWIIIIVSLLFVIIFGIMVATGTVDVNNLL